MDSDWFELSIKKALWIFFSLRVSLCVSFSTCSSALAWKFCLRWWSINWIIDVRFAWYTPSQVLKLIWLWYRIAVTKKRRFNADRTRSCWFLVVFNSHGFVWSWILNLVAWRLAFIITLQQKSTKKKSVIKSSKRRRTQRQKQKQH